jgi:Type II secretion system (T2SS), protein G
MHKAEVGNPTSREALRALLEQPTSEPYVKGGVPADPWNQP